MHCAMRILRRWLWTLTWLTTMTTATVHADPALREQMDVSGNFVLLGNTLAHECASGVPAPLVGSIGLCPDVNTAAPDVYWQADPSNGTATADAATISTDASSVAVLKLPDGAQIVYARLYWGGLSPDMNADPNARLQRFETALDEEIIAEDTITVLQPPALTSVFYQATADVSEIVAAEGPGPFLVTDVESTLNLSSQTGSVAAWYMVVFYELDGEPQRNLAIFDSLEFVDGSTSSSVSLSGFTVPHAGFDASLGVVAFEGEQQFDGDTISFNGAALSDALNPATNFFNATRGRFGVPVSEVGDLPQLSGAARSLSNVDMDVVNVTALVEAGDTTASVVASSSIDVYLLSAFVTSIATLAPSFTDSVKSATDSNGGEVIQGDTIEYHIIVRNLGTDAAEQVVLRDPLPEGVTFVPKSLKILSGKNSGDVTDEVDGDFGEYDDIERTVIFRLGAGATATAGGTMEIGEESEISFQVTIDEDTIGTISNQGLITAVGRAGNPETVTPTDADDTVPGQSTTDVVINECESNDDCDDPVAPICDQRDEANECVGCTDSSQCMDSTAPDCNTDTNTCECTAGPGACENAECMVDSDCGGINSGAICVDGMCVPGCREMGGNACHAGETCTSMGMMPGQCVPVPPMDAGKPDLGEFAGAGGRGCSVARRAGPARHGDLIWAGCALLWLARCLRRRRGA